MKTWKYRPVLSGARARHGVDRPGGEAKRKRMKMKTVIEHIDHLGPQWQELVQAVPLNNFRDVDHAKAKLTAWFPKWFVYTGSRHVALHLTNGDERRILIISEAP